MKRKWIACWVGREFICDYYYCFLSSPQPMLIRTVDVRQEVYPFAKVYCESKHQQQLPVQGESS